MSVDVLSRSEATPASYPAVPSGLSSAAAALDSGMIWARIEAYVAHRWTGRDVTYVLEGCGFWQPDLTPFAIGTKKKWSDNAWVAVTTLNTGPLGGLELLGDIYQISGTAGSGATVPANVNEAFRRLAEYMSAQDNKPGASSFSVDLAGGISTSYDRAPTWFARAMQYSGAGDLLRPYRRA